MGKEGAVKHIMAPQGGSTIYSQQTRTEDAVAAWRRKEAGVSGVGNSDSGITTRGKSAAKEVEEQTREHYRREGCISMRDLVQHLKRGKIDTSVAAKHRFSGAEYSYDESLAVFYYPDGSCLIVGTSVLESARREI